MTAEVLNISEKEAMECMENLKEEYEENAQKDNLLGLMRIKG